MRIRTMALALGVLAVGACKDATRPNSNNPSVDDFSHITDVSQVQALVTGVLADDRGQNTSEISRAETMGRDMLIITGSEPRWITELLGNTVDPSDFLGSSVYPFNTIRLANIGIHGVDSAATSVLSDEERNATLGFLKTFKAVEYMRAIEMRDTAGIPIDVDIPPTEPPAPLRCKADVLEYIAQLLDSAAVNLSAGGTEFPVALPSGFAGFDTPADFLKFNRGLAAKVDIYRAFQNGPSSPDAAALDSANAALAASFMDPTADLHSGPMHVYSTASGDATNGLFQNGTEYANPRVVSEADAGDARLAKVDSAATRSGGGSEAPDKLSSHWEIAIFNSTTAPMPILTNAELLMLQAEAMWGQGQLDSAMAITNLVRTEAGHLTAKTLTDPTDVLNQILYEKRYTLLFESPSRWVDARLFGKMNGSEPPAGLGQERARDPLNNLPTPQSEINARGGDLTKVCNSGT